MYNILLITFSAFAVSIASAQTNEVVGGGTTSQPSPEVAAPATAPAAPQAPYKKETLSPPATTTRVGADNYQNRLITLSGEMAEFTWEMDVTLNYVSTEGERMSKPNDLKVGQIRCKRKEGGATSPAPTSTGSGTAPTPAFQVCTLLGYEVSHTEYRNQDRITLQLSQHDASQGACGSRATRRISLRAICN